MKSNYVKLYDRLTKALTKKRLLPIILSTQTIVFTLVALIFANLIISRARAYGDIDYNQIKMFYNGAIYAVLISISITTPIFLAKSINSAVKNNTLEYLLATGIKTKDLVYAIFVRGLNSVLIVIFAALPIVSVSFFFGGVGIARIIRVLILYFSYAILLSSISLFLSANMLDISISMFFSYILAICFLIVYFFSIEYIVMNNSMTIFNFLGAVILSLILTYFSRQGRVFSI